MAERDDIRDRTRRLNPGLLPLCDAIERAALESGYRGVTVITTEDMTRDEEELVLFAGFLKEGYSPEAAATRAREFAALMREVF